MGFLTAFVAADGNISLEPIYSPPRFSVAVFMALVAGITLVSLVAFILLDCLPSGLGRPATLAYRKQHAPLQQVGVSASTSPTFEVDAEGGKSSDTKLVYIPAGVCNFLSFP